MSELDLLYTDVEESVRDSVRSLLAKRSTPDRVVKVYDGDRSGLAELWRALASELGLAALLIPEEHGGAGASAREAAVVLEELGRHVTPVPFFTSAVVATTALLEAGATERLGELAAGERTAALAVPFSTAPGGRIPAVGLDGTLQGSVHAVAGALEADLLLVPVRTGDGLELHEVSGGDARITPVTSLDMTRQIADVDLTGVSSRRVAGAETTERALVRALEAGAALLASEQYGVAQWCLDTTLDYLKVRRQFGRIVGGFQALKHRLADLYVTVESARAAARNAAAAIAADDPDRSVAASVAQAYCADAAVLAAEEAIQLHGGIGMTWEHPAHLYLKRAKADQIALGTPGAHHARLAALVDLPAA
ncbi:acyl-CoA dehydrogenase family protein [Thermomonospora catenispora]|uniref:acyl-CoA dehydrogenase family protein n=1 Tax=Thermomonospora catenispora TaxID=2493090 RepID=UPI0011240194|nr:acyl-CoA dehydrogenase family protein [Thermomonospora catenispora]TNY34472.1 acyl-CoA dehydrogenase [Thermomonospora catenispora]